MSTNSGPGPQAAIPGPTVHWPHYRYAKWLIGGFMVLWTVALWYKSLAGARWMGPQFYLLVIPIQLYAFTSNVRYVLTDGLLSIVRATGTVQSVPLATAELERWFSGMRIRWSEGTHTRSVTATFSATFMDQVKRAVRSAGPGSTPATAAEAAHATTFGFPAALHTVWALILFVAVVAFCAAATYWNQPLMLLPWALLALLIDRKATSYMLMLSGEHLWVLRPGEAPHPIPLTAVRHISDGIQTVVITTADATYPQIAASGYRSGDLLKKLKRRL